MTQKYGHLANQTQQEPFTCLICETEPVCWTWGDIHGEAMCTQCGTPYQLLQYTDKDEDGNRTRIDAPPRLNIKESWIPLLKQYWTETKAFTGLASIMIWRDYPECEKGQEKFYAWLDEHKDLIPVEETN